MRIEYQPESSRRRRHDGRHKLVDLRERRRVQPQPVSRDPVQRSVVEDDDAIGALGQSLERQERVVRLHHYVADADVGNEVAARLLVREDAVSLDQLLRIPRIKPNIVLITENSVRQPGPNAIRLSSASIEATLKF